MAAELIRYCRSQLAGVKCPRTVDFRVELPRHPTGKLYKRELQFEEYRRMGYDPDVPLAKQQRRPDPEGGSSWH
jgi:acyl-coenzyme A synthetase/AMP-(fatty) acid ligase